jgi:hypothetical protein
MEHFDPSLCRLETWLLALTSAISALITSAVVLLLT